MARPRKEIDQEQFEKLCGIQCTKEEIADWFDCSEDTIENFCKKTYGESFSVVFAKKRRVGRISLRRSQWQLAKKNAAMAIFLGKNYLGQSDKADDETGKEALNKLDAILEGINREAER